jgi:hypothetical protein
MPDLVVAVDDGTKYDWSRFLARGWLMASWGDGLDDIIIGWPTEISDDGRCITFDMCEVPHHIITTAPEPFPISLGSVPVGDRLVVESMTVMGRGKDITYTCDRCHDVVFSICADEHRRIHREGDLLEARFKARQRRHEAKARGGTG